MITSILIGLAALSLLVLTHELGHFFSAKAVKVRVEEFGIGFPPKLLSLKLGETLYTINAIPFGGFNKLTGEEDPTHPRSFASKNVAARLLVLGAGSIMNILLSLLLLSAAFMVPHNIVSGKVVVREVADDSPAAISGIQSGDTIISINGKTLNSTADLSRYVQLNLGKESEIRIEHNDGTIDEIQVTPRWRPPEGQGAIGVLVGTAEATIVRQSEPFWRAIPQAAQSQLEIFVLYKNGIISMVIGSVPAALIGPVGIVQMTGEVAKAGISPLLELTAFISLILGIVNLFPIPALDGGRIAFVLLEWVRRGKRVSAKTERKIHAIGFFLLIAAMLAITYQDISRIITGESLIP
ncbi:RIP metalloprotease RseP [Chloroflexota bacterium]